MKKIFLALIAFGLFSACDGKGNKDETVERATAEGEASRDVDNKNQAQKAQTMEADLANRHRIYSALEGKFEGTVMVENETYNMRLTIVRNLPQYKGDRTRQLSEIENDLTNLSFTAQVVQWHPSDTATAVGCRITQVRPNFNTGVVVFTAPECPSAYTFLFSQDGATGRAEATAVDLANRVVGGEIGFVNKLVGTIQPTWNAKTFTLDIKRVN